jgi:hypothetical protein
MHQNDLPLSLYRVRFPATNQRLFPSALTPGLRSVPALGKKSDESDSDGIRLIVVKPIR